MSIFDQALMAATLTFWKVFKRPTLLEQKSWECSDIYVLAVQCELLRDWPRTVMHKWKKALRARTRWWFGTRYNLTALPTPVPFQMPPLRCSPKYVLCWCWQDLLLSKHVSGWCMRRYIFIAGNISCNSVRSFFILLTNCTLLRAHKSLPPAWMTRISGKEIETRSFILDCKVMSRGLPRLFPPAADKTVPNDADCFWKQITFWMTYVSTLQHKKICTNQAECHVR